MFSAKNDLVLPRYVLFRLEKFLSDPVEYHNVIIMTNFSDFIMHHRSRVMQGAILL